RDCANSWVAESVPLLDRSGFVAVLEAEPVRVSVDPLLLTAGWYTVPLILGGRTVVESFEFSCGDGVGVGIADVELALFVVSPSEPRASRASFTASTLKLLSGPVGSALVLAFIASWRASACTLTFT